MLAHLSTSARAVCLAVALFLGVGWSTAEAINISIGGIIYDVVLTSGGTDYLAHRDDIMASPWWNSTPRATEARNNFFPATGGNFGVTAGIDTAVFVFSETGSTLGDTHTAMTVTESGVFVGPISIANNTAGATIAFAYVVPTPVPEIDGNALFKALFCLFTLALWLQLRRQRRALG